MVELGVGVETEAVADTACGGILTEPTFDGAAEIFEATLTDALGLVCRTGASASVKVF